MRIFSLTTDEAVAIGDDIVIKVVEIIGDEVRLAIEHSDGMMRTTHAGNLASKLQPPHAQLAAQIGKAR